MNLIGIPIGFYGYLFPGSINLMVINLYQTRKYKMLLMVLLLLVLFESLYCGVSLYYLQQLKVNTLLFYYIECFAHLLIFCLGIWMIFENKQTTQQTQQNLLYRGIISIIIHPQQVPFWVVIGVLLAPVLHLEGDKYALLSFVAFNALGTLLIMAVYMVYGSRLLSYFQWKFHQLNTVMGLFYISFVVYSFF